MEFQYINVTILFLLALVTLNLMLTLRLINIMRTQVNQAAVKPPLLIGSIIDDFSAQCDFMNSVVRFSDYSTTKVIIFLSSGCPTCKSKISEVATVISLAKGEGLEPLIVTSEAYNPFRVFLNDTALLPSLLRVDKETYEKINPQGASPSYLFVSEANTLEAEGMIGDENWLGLVEQLSSLKEQTLDEECSPNAI